MSRECRLNRLFKGCSKGLRGCLEKKVQVVDSAWIKLFETEAENVIIHECLLTMGRLLLEAERQREYRTSHVSDILQ